MKNTLIALGIAALMSSPVIAQELDSPVESFVSPTEEFVLPTSEFGGVISDFGTPDSSNDTIVGTPTELYTEGTERVDSRLPRVEHPVDLHRNRAYNNTDPSSVHNNQNVVETEDSPGRPINPLIVDDRGNGRLVTKTDGDRSVVISRDRTIRGFTFNK